MIYDQDYTLDFASEMPNIIKVIGVGGGGGNAILNMHKKGVHNVDFVACNTDSQALKQFPDDVIKIQLGIELTKGLGAGTDWKVGEQAAIESETLISEVLKDPTEMVFITAGMGGGTGTGAAPIIAKLAKELGRLTVGVVTDPFSHEGSDKIDSALRGIAEMKKYCDTVLIIKNDRLVDMYGDLTLDDALEKADDVLANGVKSIAELITRPGKINLDFADVKTVLGNAGHAVLGSAEASGPERSYTAIEQALNSPLLENNDILGAKRILVSIGYSDEKEEYKIKMSDQSKVTKYVEEKIQGTAKIFKHGFAIDRSLGDKVRVTIVAAGFESKSFQEEYTVVPSFNYSDHEYEESGPKQRETTETINKKKQKPVLENNSQIILFIEQEKFNSFVNSLTRIPANYKELEEVPAYQRYGVELVSIDEIEDLNTEKHEIKNFYNKLLEMNAFDK